MLCIKCRDIFSWKINFLENMENKALSVTVSVHLENVRDSNFSVL